MKLNTTPSPVSRGGISAESTFTIKTNALSFKILSSGLYTDPRLAVVRELSCNAYDAHVAANNRDTPFQIHLPNSTEPFLSIKDFGIGLSDADIQGGRVPVLVEDKNGEMVQQVDDDGEPLYTYSGGLYTTYFDSTKTTSNEFIGALGLGSKSPFSYTDSFEVISRFDGIKTTYAIFLNENGIPTVARLGQIATDEHSGLEVKIPVKETDFRAFESRVASCLKYFPVKPTVVGVLHFKYDEVYSDGVQTDKWLIHPIRWSRDYLTAVQGNVSYRVDIAQIENLTTHMANMLRSLGVVLFFNIGELDVSANREEIRYDVDSLKALTDRLNDIEVEFPRELARMVDHDKCFWDNYIALDLKLHTAIGTTGISNFIEKDDIDDDILRRYAYSDDNHIEAVIGYDISMYSIRSNATGLVREKGSAVDRLVRPSSSTLIVINDIKTAAIKRLAMYAKQAMYRNVILIKQREPAIVLDADLKEVPYIGHDAELTQIKENLGVYEIKLLSEVSEPVRRDHIPSSLQVYQYRGLAYNKSYGNNATSIYWDSISDFDDTGSGVYVPLKYGKKVATIVDGKLIALDYDSPSDIVNGIEYILTAYNQDNDVELRIDEITFVGTKAYNKIKNNPAWVPLLEYAKELLVTKKDLINHNEKARLTHTSCQLERFVDNNTMVEYVKGLAATSEFKLAVEPLIDASRTLRVSKSTVAAIKLLYRNLVADDSNHSVTPYFDGRKLLAQYPLLDLISHHSVQYNMSKIFDYINLIDRDKK